MSRRFVLNLFKYLLAFGLLGYVVWSNWLSDSDRGLAHVWNKHAVHGEPIGVGYLALGFALISASMIVTLVRWYFLVRAQDMPFRLRDAMRLGLIGFFFNTFLPGSVGGDVVKAAGIARGQKRRTVAVATVIMDRAIAVWAMIWMVAILGILFWSNGMLEGRTAAQRIVRSACIISAVSAVVWVLLGFLPQRKADRFASRLSCIPKVGYSAAEFWRAVWMYRCRQHSVYLALALTWLGQIGFVFGFFCCVMTVWDPQQGAIPSAAEHFLLVPVGLIIQAAPLFPGGAGIGEAGFGGLYAWFGSAAAIAVLGSLIMRVITWVFAICGFIVAQKLEAVPTPAEEPSADSPSSIPLHKTVRKTGAVA